MGQQIKNKYVYFFMSALLYISLNTFISVVIENFDYSEEVYK